MKITQEDSVYQLTFFPALFPVNCYLADEGTTLTLIDAALPFSYKGILKAVEKIGKPITRIVLTHAHSDHIGSLDRLKKLLPDCEVIMSARDAKLLKGDATLEEDEPQTPVRGGVPKPGQIQTTPDTLVSEGDIIGSFQVIASPGHTPGHIALYNEKTKVLIAGDAFQIRGGVAVSGEVKPLFPFPAWATWNKEAAIQSAIKLKDLSPNLLCAGHGKLLKHPKGIMIHAIQQAKKALKGRTK
ncbi:MBL fold metallo-hydrolase [Sporolactobacillus pectinivorans]|uniref:MBL fold metallo-hydrolase n=1 Tax=Sporolactobacillus pectinivorans TaxID=1591408 RepID=UPI000C269DF9|nr:MBL fold metallo-hydrolase [Sporolactobacillus pectinivorans]